MTETETARGAPRKWRGREPEDRRAARHEQLIEAGLDIMGTEGAAATTMRATCRRAGLTERYFYESFKNRDELLIAVLDRVVLGARDTLIAALGTAPGEPRELIRHVVRSFTDYVATDRRRGRIMFVESQSVPELAQRGEQLVKEFTAPIAASLEILSDSAEPDSLTIALNSIAIFGALAFLYQHWLAGSSRISKRRIVEHVSLVIEAQINVDSTPLEAGERSP
ncbi:TetR/AcrR family transcriptional regulator [Rhodococcus sp. ZPP]|uniref:TetR/AcrR family transcriptional regulator n=1 Tax=Rhodococcus sp. ZPP TaxID=2749906 RepID=UPI001AD85B1E|nr:TetR/AcrR family transcriptional regulator [Rhodococcus sp. ZPP]QTJ66516.1 TetR/AcrR family transcriptional regulator [Rhodococcus sp. ZPP]